VDGMLYLMPSVEDKYLEEVVAEGFPFIQVGSSLESSSLSSVTGDNTAGGEMATRHLVELGHKRIGMVTGPRKLKLFSDRAAGFLKVMAEEGLSTDPENVFEIGFSSADAEKVSHEIFQKGTTAILAGNDLMAAGALRAAKKLGLNVPGQVSIVGMDDLTLATLLDTPLTTVRTDFKKLSSVAVERLVEIIEDRGPRHVQEVLPMELIVRSSTGPAPKSS